MKTAIFFFFFVFSSTAFAQIKTTKETKVIAVVTNNAIIAIEQFETYRDNENELIKKYPKSIFFIGLLSGKYEVKKGAIIPQNDTAITIYTEKQIFQKTGIFSKREHKLGEVLAIGKTKAKVISSKKGELIIKTNN